MMSRPTNNLRHARMLAVLISGLAIVLPSVASARQSQPRQSTPTIQRQEAAVGSANFCSLIDVLSERIMKEIILRETRYAAAETQKQNTLADTLAKRDAMKLEARNAWDSSRDEIFFNLRARANTPLEQNAVDVFEKSIDAAVALRRKNIDTALDTFKTGVDKALSSRKSGVEDAIKAFRDTTDTALVNAKTSCASGTPSLDVREAYVSDLTDGKREFLSAVQAAQKSDGTMIKLVNDRDASIEGANNLFKKALNQAQKELKKSFSDA